MARVRTWRGCAHGCRLARPGMYILPTCSAAGILGESPGGPGAPAAPPGALPMHLLSPTQHLQKDRPGCYTLIISLS